MVAATNIRRHTHPFAVTCWGQRQHRMASLRWLAFVAIATVSLTSGDAVQVMSYNTKYDGYPHLINDFANKIREVRAAVVGLQECQDPARLAALSGYRLVQGTGAQNYIVYDPDQVQRVIDSGSFDVISDTYAQRAVTWAKFQLVSGAEFFFFNTHLPHNLGDARDRNTHARIARQLLEVQERIGGAEAPTVVVCDCNPFASAGAREGSFESNLAAAGFSKAYQGRGNPGFSGLDKIFVNEKLSATNGADRGTGKSDHPAITADILFTPAGGGKEPLPDDCASVWDKVATDSDGAFTCGDRITWLQSRDGGQLSKAAAKARVASEFPVICGACLGSATPDATASPTPVKTSSPTFDDTAQPTSRQGANLVWSDEFNGDKLDESKWNKLTWPAFRVNNELQAYTDRKKNVFLRDGALVIRAQREDYNGAQFTSGRLTSSGKGDWKYGRFEARAQLPVGAGSGTWPAIWMLPTESKFGSWPKSGEIDIMEHVACDKGKVHSTVHTAAFNHMKNTQKGASTTVDDVREWHVYGLEWTPDFIYGFVDGRKYFTFARNDRTDSARWPFNQDFHWVLNVAIGGDWGGYCLNGALPNLPKAGTPEGDPAWQRAEMRIDWVRVYELDEAEPPVATDDDCGAVWDKVATDSSGSFSCGERISWLQTADGGRLNMAVAKKRVAREFPSICGPCGDEVIVPKTTTSPTTKKTQAPRATSSPTTKKTQAPTATSSPTAVTACSSLVCKNARLLDLCTRKLCKGTGDNCAVTKEDASPTLSCVNRDTLSQAEICKALIRRKKKWTRKWCATEPGCKLKKIRRKWKCVAK